MASKRIKRTALIELPESWFDVGDPVAELFWAQPGAAAYYSRAEALDVFNQAPSVVEEYRKFVERDRKRRQKPKRGRNTLLKTEAQIEALARLMLYEPELKPRERAARLGLSVTDYWTFWKRNKAKVRTALDKLIRK